MSWLFTSGGQSLELLYSLSAASWPPLCLQMLPSLLKAFKPTRVIPFLNPKPSNSTGLSLKGLLYYSPPSSILCINKGCCCCQVASVVSDSVQPHRWQPTRLLYPWDSPSKNIGVGCHFLLQCMKVKSESEVTQ